MAMIWYNKTDMGVIKYVTVSCDETFVIYLTVGVEHISFRQSLN